MQAIELEAIAHDGKLEIDVPGAYRELWDGKRLRVWLVAAGDSVENPKPSLMSALPQIKIVAPEDFSENLDAYLNGEKHV